MGKRLNGEGTYRERPNGLWEGRITLPDGRRLSRYGKTQTEARAKLTSAMISVRDGVDPDAGNQTLGDYLDRWLDDVVKPTLAPKTYASYAELCRVHIVPTLGKIRLSKLSPQDVTRLMRTKQEAGLSPRTVQYIRSVLRIALNRAVKWQLVARNVVTLTDAPKVRRSEIKPLTPEQARTLLTAAEGDRLEALYRVALALGLRLGEALGLSWDDIDLTTGTLRVRRSLQRIDKKLSLKEPKTEKSRRTLTMPQTLATALRHHRVRQIEERLAAGDLWQDHGLVFTTSKGTPLEPSNVLKRFKTLLASAGLPSQRFHDLRHCAASLLIAQGVPVKVVADILGHSQLATTSDLYAHIFPAAHREAADLMDQILFTQS